MRLTESRKQALDVQVKLQCRYRKSGAAKLDTSTVWLTTACFAEASIAASPSFGGASVTTTEAPRQILRKRSRLPDLEIECRTRSVSSIGFDLSPES